MSLSFIDTSKYSAASGVHSEVFSGQNPDGRGFTRMHHHFWTYAQGVLTIGLDRQLIDMINAGRPATHVLQEGIVGHALDVVLYDAAKALGLHGKMAVAVEEVILITTEEGIVFNGVCRQAFSEKAYQERIWGEEDMAWSVDRPQRIELRNRAWSYKRQLPELKPVEFDLLCVEAGFSPASRNWVNLILLPRLDDLTSAPTLRFEIVFTLYGRNQQDSRYELQVNWHGNLTPYLKRRVGSARDEEANNLLHCAVLKAASFAKLIAEQNLGFTSAKCSQVLLMPEDATTQAYLQSNQYKDLLKTVKGE